MNAIILNLIAITIVVGGCTALVWAFYTRLDDSRSRSRTARGHEGVQTPEAGSRPATRENVRRAA